MNFTPGPWKKNKWGELLGNDGKVVSVWDAGISFSGRTEITEANAHLIAAAPDLYAALKAVVVRGCGCYAVADENYHSDKCPIPQVKAALAKAEGKQP